MITILVDNVTWITQSVDMTMSLEKKNRRRGVMRESVRNEMVVVTGASTGIGAATARQLASDGFHEARTSSP
jgi:hypothetical protein